MLMCVCVCRNGDGHQDNAMRGVFKTHVASSGRRQATRSSADYLIFVDAWLSYTNTSEDLCGSFVISRMWSCQLSCSRTKAPVREYFATLWFGNNYCLFFVELVRYFADGFFFLAVMWANVTVRNTLSPICTVQRVSKTTFPSTPRHLFSQYRMLSGRVRKVE